MLTQEDIQDLISFLENSSVTLSEACQYLFNVDEDYLTEEDYEAIYSEIFYCEECGWWYNIEECREYYEKKVCSNCYEDLLDEEEYGEYY